MNHYWCIMNYFLRYFMKSFTIHNIDEKLAKEIKKLAQREGKSVNQTVKALLQKTLGHGSDEEVKKTEFLDLFGVWSEDDILEFEKNIDELNIVDERDWK
jgi:plasmid stability protein